MITVHEAAALLDGTDAWVRSLIRRGKIGDAWNGGRWGKRYTYRIVPGQLAEFMRISEDELERRLTKVREQQEEEQRIAKWKERVDAIRHNDR